MIIRTLLLVLPAVFAIGCAAESGSTEASADSVATGTDDLGGESETSPATAAKGRDPVVDQARADKLVGEEATGYLALVNDGELIAGKDAPGDLEARVSDINDKRRALYADLASKNGVTIEEVAQTTACTLLKDKVQVGEAYRPDRRWQVRVFDLPVKAPAFCDNVQ